MNYNITAVNGGTTITVRVDSRVSYEVTIQKESIDNSYDSY